jgi:hypothetical protein
MQPLFDMVNGMRNTRKEWDGFIKYFEVMMENGNWENWEGLHEVPRDDSIDLEWFEDSNGEMLCMPLYDENGEVIE